MTLAAQSRAMASSFLRFFEITHQSVGLLWTSDQLFAETSTWQHTTLTTDKHPCPRGIRTHNLARRAAADLRLRPRGHWDRRHCLLKRYNSGLLENAWFLERLTCWLLRNIITIFQTTRRHIAEGSNPHIVDGQILESHNHGSVSGVHKSRAPGRPGN